MAIHLSPSQYKRLTGQHQPPAPRPSKKTALPALPTLFALTPCEATGHTWEQGRKGQFCTHCGIFLPVCVSVFRQEEEACALRHT